MAEDLTPAGVENTDATTSNSNAPTGTMNSTDRIIFSAGRPGHSATFGHDMFSSRTSVEDVNLMGPLLRRKKAISLPLGAGGDFFYTASPGNNTGQQRTSLLNEYEAHHAHLHRHPRERVLSHDPNRQHQHRHQKQNSLEGAAGAAVSKSPPQSPHRRRRQVTPTQKQFMKGILRRRQVSLDLLGPNDFFGVPEDEEAPLLYDGVVDEEAEEAEEGEVPTTVEEEEEEGEEAESSSSIVVRVTEKNLFAPLRFAPRQKLKHGAASSSGHDGHPTNNGGPRTKHHEDQITADDAIVDLETQQSLERYITAHEQVKAEMIRLSKAIPEENSSQVSDLMTRMERMGSDHTVLKQSLLKSVSSSSTSIIQTEESSDDNNKDDEAAAAAAAADASVDESFNADDDNDDDSDVIRAGRSDKIRAGICFLVMVALTLVVTLWHTHRDEDVFLLGPVGLACVTNCSGDLVTRDFFEGHYHFQENEVIDLVLHLDGNILAEEVGAHAYLEIVGTQTGEVKATHEFGPPGEERLTLTHHIVADFAHLEEAHIINVNSTDPNVELSFTLLANVKTPLADHSVIVAAVIMVLVYGFILLEVIHRTLIAIYGSMVALMFFFIMEGGHVEPIKIIMLHLEWSTLGLLFGMMLMVGELSHTGVFEWCAVRILIFSKGSYVRLLVLLSVLTAVASAFLDNVTTMLLVAPVTIDMCHIVGDIDPRPYLIAEVILSNIGGTATLIGDPPNIIIGSAFSEVIGFVDFIVHVMPVIFVFCVPASLLLVVYLYRWYLTSSKMRVLDTALLKKTYKIYDEPRLLISGIVTMFVILMFFLHPLHHKDTAWIALMGAFITISFTNPHDIQSALRSHVEWDTLLFFAGLFVLVEVCAAMGLLQAIGDALASYISSQEADQQLTVAITLLLWVSAFASSFLDNIPYTATMIPVLKILAAELPDTLPLQTLAWALSLGACLGGNGTLLGASANIVTAGISANKGYEISFVNFFYPGMLVMILTVAIANVYMLVRYVWI